MLLTLPLEIKEQIILCCPQDIGNLSRVCRSLHAIIYNPNHGDNHLWRSLFLSLDEFDDPRLSEDYVPNFNWRKEFQHRFKFLKIIQHQPTEASIKDRRFAVKTLLQILTSSIPPYPQPTKIHRWTALRSWFAFEDLLPDSPEDIALCSQIRTFLRCRSSSTIKDRAFIYDSHNYNKANFWGPFIPDGSRAISWNHVYHLRNTVIDPALPVLLNLDKIRPYSCPGWTSRASQDWAGVEGQWRGWVTFLEPDDFIAYNFSSPNDGPLDVAALAKDHHFLLFQFQIKILRSEKPVPGSPWPDRPKLHLTGTSINHTLRGSVEMLPYGMIDWSLILVKDGRNWAWRGIQLSLGCALGVQGIWSVPGPEQEYDPLGPFLLWKCNP